MRQIRTSDHCISINALGQGEIYMLTAPLMLLEETAQATDICGGKAPSGVIELERLRKSPPAMTRASSECHRRSEP